MSYRYFYTFLLCMMAWNVSCQGSDVETDTVTRRSIYAVKFGDLIPEIDGKVDDAAWDMIEWVGGFTENDPDNGAKAVQKTEIKLGYDERFLYLAAFCYDSEPDSIVSRMGRRDNFPGDWVEINIDTNGDLLTGNSFNVSASGVKGDEEINPSGFWDANWNPIWYTKTEINESGWTAEMKIPLTQLRFPSTDIQNWSFQINRLHFRDGSRSFFQFIPNDAPYWVRGFAKMDGIEGIKPQKQLEIQPFVLSQFEAYPAETGNPYADGNDFSFNAGIDGKIGLTNNIILDFTINPDFGQVEADPSQLVLDGFEVFFSERRPFFLEGNTIFNNALSNFESDGSFNNDRLFYSRRIGRSPSGSVFSLEGDYVDVPLNSTILGATKVSGRTNKGFSFGILESITAKELAKINRDGEELEQVVEPLTSYFVSRFKQDFNDNNTTIGGSFNAVNRFLNESDLEDQLIAQAYTGGIDITHRWDDQKWLLSGNISMSQLLGSQTSIEDKQRSFLHLYDRVDADHLTVDTTATHLGGHAGSTKIGHFGKKWRFTTGLSWRSPGFDSNDLGFINNTDVINHVFWGAYNIRKPTKLLNSAQFNYNHYSFWDFSGLNYYNAVNQNSWLQFKNFWSINYGINFELKDIARRALFGGPALNRPLGGGINIGFNSDDRKNLVYSAYSNQGIAYQNSVRFQNYGIVLRWQPINALNLSLSPSYTNFKRKFFFIPNAQINDGTRYVGGTLKQNTFNLTARINFNITPDLTIQYYGSPFVTRGHYSEFKEIVNASAKYDDRFLPYGNAIKFDAEGDSYFLDSDNNGQADCENCTFSNPDFNFVQFRSNLVLRWEYIPGSELYLVWAQNTTALQDPDIGIFNALNQTVIQEKGNHIFLLKFTYRFLL